MPPTRIASIAALLVTAAGTAVAQPALTEPTAAPAPAPVAPPATPPPAPPAPQTNEWSEVSHINGQLVKVGEKSDYLYKFRRFNVGVNPLGWIIGAYGVSASYGITQNIAVRGDATYMNSVLTEDAYGMEFSLDAIIYFRRTYSGPFLEPGFMVRHMKYGDGDYHTSNTYTEMGPQALLGWHWSFDSGFNIAFAGGVGRNLHSSSDDDEQPIFANGYMRVGYAF